VFLNHRHGPLTRFGIRYILARRLTRASRDVPTLRKKRLHPHSVRHSTAVALLKSGADLSTISHYLGHANLNTTNRYAKLDLEMKRKAIAMVKAVPRQSRTQRFRQEQKQWCSLSGGPASNQQRGPTGDPATQEPLEARQHYRLEQGRHPPRVEPFDTLERANCLAAKLCRCTRFSISHP
jgi:hypothetical protein